MEKKIFFDKYSHMFDDFYQNVRKVPVLTNISGPQIPGFGSDYPHADKKILYIGIETIGWDLLTTSFDEYQKSKDEFLQYYIWESSNCINSFRFLEWFNNGKSPFWRYVIKMQCELFSISFDEFVKTPYDGKFNKMLKSFAWANTKSINEIPIMEYCYGNVNEESWDQVKKYSTIFDDVSIMSEIMKPDLIVILNWGEDYSFIKKHYDYSEPEKYLNNKLEYMKLKNSCHLIWTYHPRGMLWKGGIDKFVKKTTELITEKKIFSNKK